MASDLKAVVEIAADTSGLVKGIDGAMKKLESASGSTALFTGISAASAVLGQVLGFAEKAYQAMSDQAAEWDRMSKTWSPMAMNASMMHEVATMKDEEKIGKALAPSAVQHDLYAQAVEAMDAERVVALAPKVNAGKLALQNLGTDATSLGKNIMTNAFASTGEFVQDPMETLKNAWLSNMSFGMYARDEKGDWGIRSTEFEPGRGMNQSEEHDHWGTLLGEIRDLLKGR